MHEQERDMPNAELLDAVIAFTLGLQTGASVQLLRTRLRQAIHADGETLVNTNTMRIVTRFPSSHQASVAERIRQLLEEND